MTVDKKKALFKTRTTAISTLSLLHYTGGRCRQEPGGAAVQAGHARRARVERLQRGREANPTQAFGGCMGWLGGRLEARRRLLLDISSCVHFHAQNGHSKRADRRISFSSERLDLFPSSRNEGAVRACPSQVDVFTMRRISDISPALPSVIDVVPSQPPLHPLVARPPPPVPPPVCF